MPLASPPEFFTDRSLGRHIVVDALRQAGAAVHPMADVEGVRIGQGLRDEKWLRDAETHGWVVLMKDARLRRRPAELEVLVTHRVRASCLTNANLGGVDQAQRLVSNLERILRLVEAPGPFINGVYADAVERLWPR